ncbi:hypothetical protein [Limnobacter litoralis]|nr:hypothetical protein [Limnobacter litoralis]
MMTKILQLEKSCNELLSIFQVENEQFYAKKFKKFIDLLSAIEEGGLTRDEALGFFRDEFRALYTPHSGLGEYFVWRDDFETRRAINLRIKEALNSIWHELDL